LRAITAPPTIPSNSGRSEATRVEIYRGTGFCEHAGHLAEARAESQTERAEGTIGRAFLTGVPAFSDSAASEFPLWMHALETAGIAVMAAIPLIARGRLTAILAWYF
jgi:hypothetical protein